MKNVVSLSMKADKWSIFYNEYWCKQLLLSRGLIFVTCMKIDCSRGVTLTQIDTTLLNASADFSNSV